MIARIRGPKIMETTMPSDTAIYRDILRWISMDSLNDLFRDVPDYAICANWHIELMGAALEDCRQGRNQAADYHVAAPTFQIAVRSVALPAWLLGQNPSTQIICASYGQDLSDKLRERLPCRNDIAILPADFSPLYCTAAGSRV